MMYNWNEEETATWALGAYKYTFNPYAFEAGSHDNQLTGRMTWTPWYDEPSHGRYMMHVGFASSYQGVVNNMLQVRARGSIRNGLSQYWPVWADTGAVFGNTQTLVSPEWAMIYGPWHFQAEYTGSFLDQARTTANGPHLGTAYYSGYYVQALYFITGEYREYERKAAAFGRVVPHENFHLIRTKGRSGCIFTTGAWQIGYRFNQLDLNSPNLQAAGVSGGILDDHIIGLNHFLNPNMKIQYNVDFCHRTAPSGQVAGGAVPAWSYGFGARVAQDF
jgi:phosphate-selective porin OprO/OprP